MQNAGHLEKGTKCDKIKLLHSADKIDGTFTFGNVPDFDYFANFWTNYSENE